MIHFIDLAGKLKLFESAANFRSVIERGTFIPQIERLTNEKLERC